MIEKPLNIIFMGNPDFAVPSLKLLLQSPHNVAAVVTGADKRRGRGKSKTPSPVKQTAMEAGIPVLEWDDVRNPALAARLQSLKPDLLVVVAFKMLPPELLSIPEVGSVNLHASLLPKYRGAAPIHWAVINGEKETGCTVFMLDHGMDTGAILNRITLPVGLEETTGELYNRLKMEGAKLLRETIDDISRGKIPNISQESGKATRAPKISPDDARLDFHDDFMNVHNFIRGMSPSPGAWTICAGKKVKILRSAPAPEISLAPGQAEIMNGEGYVGCKTGSVRLLAVKPEGKKQVSGSEFLNGIGGKIQFELS